MRGLFPVFTETERKICVPLVLAISLVSLIQNNQYIIETHLGAAYHGT